MEYSDSEKRFMEAFEKGTEGIYYVSPGFSYTCQECLDAHDICCEHKGKYLWEAGEVYEEGHFSCSACELCGSKLGGNRYCAHGIIEDGHSDPQDMQIIHLSVCFDCVMYMANGDLPENWE